jgi:hypothetical protein
LADLKEATKAEIAERLGVQTQADLGRVDRAVEGLAKTGEATAISLDAQGEPIPAFQPLKYRWVASLVKARGAVQAKLWEFACLRFATAKPFSAAEAARLAECALDYAKKYCRWLWQSGYLAIISRGRNGAVLYQVVAGRETESAPPWNRRAETRLQVGQAPPPAAPAAAGIVARDPAITVFDEGIKGQKPDLPEVWTPAPMPEELKKFAANMRQAFAEFSRGMRNLAAHFPAVEAVLLEMEADLVRITKEQGHDEPGEPTEGHH